MLQASTPADFFRRHARAFQRGDYKTCAQDIVVPTVIHVADKCLVADAPQTMIDILRVFRQNLMVEGYARTEVAFYHHQSSKDGACRTLLQWQNLNARDAKINEMDVSYFCRRREGADWRIELMEIHCNGSKYLTDGLPLH